MNIFDKAKLNEKNKPLCLYCGLGFQPDKRNVQRGNGIFCSKSCAASFKTKLKFAKESDRNQLLRDKRLRELGI